MPRDGSKLPKTIYYHHEATVTCECGLVFRFPAHDVVADPPPGPGDEITCRWCDRVHVIVAEAVSPPAESGGETIG